MASNNVNADLRELVFPAADPSDPQSHEDVVVVRRTGATGPGGNPVFADSSGIVQAEISDADEVRMLTTALHQDLRSPLACRRLSSGQPPE